MEFIGSTIKSARKRTGITQTKLAELSGVSRATINALENMKAKDISVNTISAILGAIELYIKQKKTSESTLGVSQPKFNFPYVWSNQSPSDELLIKKVLERTIFDDVITLCLHYGVNKVTEVLYASNLKHDALLMVSLIRMIKNIQKGISRDFNLTTPSTAIAIKPWLLPKYIKLKDIFDLMKYMQHSGAPISFILSCVKEADPANYSEELIKLTLTGEVPLDDDDEGFTSIGLQANVNDIYRYFSALINEYEVEFAYQQQSKMRPE